MLHDEKRKPVVITGLMTRRLSGPGPALGALLLALTMLLLAAAPLRAEQPASASAAPGAEQTFNIPAQPLTDALVVFGRQAGLQVSVDGALVRGLPAPAVAGEMRAKEALLRLLAGTGLVIAETDERTLEVRQVAEAEPEAAPESLPRLSVAGEGAEETGAERDLRLKDEIYDQDISTDYLGKEDIDRFRGISTADVFQGLTNVYSGAARNGGALDANIRGIQGAGRAPVIIDGTEQALVVSRGYRGADNRSYIDPSLIAGVQALKGPVSVREVNSQIGGAIAIRTLGASDILRSGERFGVELRLEAGNNATTPRLPTLRTGQDYNQITDFLGNKKPEDNIFTPHRDPTLRVQPRTPGDNGPFAFGGDRAARIAAAGRKGNFDFFGAYAHRSRGNYFSGRNNADYYARDDLPAETEFYTRRMALKYQPGNEVTNSSSEMRSWLFKSTWRVADDQALQLGYRHTRTATGEIMPWNLDTGGRDPRNPNAHAQTTYDPDFGYIQWPLSRVRIDALNLEYKYAPETRWVDVHANLWTTRANSNTYSNGGGFPNVPRTRTDPTLINTALTHARNNRWGMTFSNKMALLPSVDFTVGGHYQYEKLRSDDPPRPRDHYAWISEGRAGNRQEYRANIQLEWRPTSFLTFNGGVGHAGYRGFDDGLNARLKRGEPVPPQTATVGYRAGYRLYAKGSAAYKAYYPPRYAARLKLYQDAARRYEKDKSSFLYKFYARRIREIQSSDKAVEYESKAQYHEAVPFEVGPFSREWRADANGRFRRASMPPRCNQANQAVLGDFDLDAASKEIVADGPRHRLQVRRGSKGLADPILRGALSEVRCAGSDSIKEEIELKSPADLKARRASGWEPYLTATLKLSDAIRLYGRYAERLRFPSLFESTIGFSASPSLFRPLKPERIRAWEGAYIQDFSALFGLGGEGQRADFKLVYFHNTVKDVIDRYGFIFANYDRQIIDGVELQARLDTGRFFLNLGAARILNNKVIDESAAAQAEFDRDTFGDGNARKHGFGQLDAQGIPPQTVHLTLGGRFFERRLELGARATHYSEYDGRQSVTFQGVRGSNTSRAFGAALVLDAYARYNFNDQLTAELVSTNITDQYYADPLSLSDIPAPGRQIRLNFTYQF